MKRWLFNIFAALLLLLFVATAALWGRSYFAADEFRLPFLRLQSHQGAFRSNVILPSASITIAYSPLPPTHDVFEGEIPVISDRLIPQWYWAHDGLRIHWFLFIGHYIWPTSILSLVIVAFVWRKTRPSVTSRAFPVGLAKPMRENCGKAE